MRQVLIRQAGNQRVGIQEPVLLIGAAATTMLRVIRQPFHEQVYESEADSE